MWCVLWKLGDQSLQNPFAAQQPIEGHQACAVWRCWAQGSSASGASLPGTPTRYLNCSSLAFQIRSSPSTSSLGQAQAPSPAPAHPRPWPSHGLWVAKQTSYIITPLAFGVRVTRCPQALLNEVLLRPFVSTRNRHEYRGEARVPGPVS